MILSKKFVSKDDIHFRWKTIPVRSSDGDELELKVSNDQVPLPEGLSVIDNFLSEDEADALLREIQGYHLRWEGFEQRRRVKRFSLDELLNCKDVALESPGEQDAKSDNLLALIDRVAERTGRVPQYVSVEEHNSLQTLKIAQYGSNGNNGILTGFESTELCECPENGECRCFVAQIPLQGSAVKHLNKPKRRHPSCFDLESSQCWTDVRVDAGSLLMQRSDCLWNWRARISAIPPQPSDRYQFTTFFIVKLHNLPLSRSSIPNDNDDSDGINFDAFGYMGTHESSICSTPMPPLEDALTIIVTTSPIASNPSTEVIEQTFNCFHQAGADFAVKCRKVIICDGFRQLENGNEEKVTRKHNNAKQAMRNGICTSAQAENYLQFKAALKNLCANAMENSPFHNTHVEALDSRLGYGFALRHALRHCTITPYVCVIQHDRTIMRPTPIAETLRAMWHHRNIKYVTMSMRSNLLYRDLFMGKYGKSYDGEFEDMILRLPELNLPKELYGPESESTRNMTSNSPKVRDSLQVLLKNYHVSKQHLGQQDWLGKNLNEPEKHQLTLTPVSTPEKNWQSR
jgi:hypothetical protein